MMPLALFRSRTFAGANLLTFWLYAALGGALFFLPFNLIQVQGYSATAGRRRPAAVHRPDVRALALVGRPGRPLRAAAPLVDRPAVAAVGFALFALPGIGGSYWTTFFPAVLVLGLGMAISVAPLTTTVMGAVEQRHAGIASGINNAVSRVAGLLAVAALGVLLLGLFGRSLEHHLATLDLSPAVRQEILDQRAQLAALKIPNAAAGPARAEIESAVAASFLTGFRGVMGTAAALALLAAASAGWLIREKP